MTLDNSQILQENLFTLFAQQVKRRPEAVAVVDRTCEKSYTELEAHAGRVAAGLVEEGLELEQPVGVLMQRSADLVSTLLGVLKAGGCYVPLDPDDPYERTSRIAKEAGCKFVVGHSLLLKDFRVAMTSLPDLATDIVYLDSTEAGANVDDTETILPEPLPPAGNRLAYVLFTSGSTGNPKGVEVEHRSVINLLLAVRDLLGFTESDRYLATSTIGFDISVAEIFLPLITGGSVMLHDRRLVLEPGYLADEIRKHGVTVFQTGPSVWSVILAEVADFPRLRVAISTGEAISPALANRLSVVGDSVWNLYGPTEATVWATGHRLGSSGPVDPNRSSISAPIGRPFVNVDVRGARRAAVGCAGRCQR